MGRETNMVKPKKREIQRVRNYIASVHWKFAKTYAKTWPHEYTVKDWNPDKKKEFEFFVMFIREYGYPEMFFRKHHIYYNLDGYKYWTMGAPLEQTIIINRVVLEEVR